MPVSHLRAVSRLMVVVPLARKLNWFAKLLALGTLPSLRMSALVRALLKLAFASSLVAVTLACFPIYVACCTLELQLHQFCF